MGEGEGVEAINVLDQRLHVTFTHFHGISNISTGYISCSVE